MSRLSILTAALGLGLVVFSFGRADAACRQEDEACLVIPEDAPASVELKSKAGPRAGSAASASASASAAAPARSSFVTERERSGGALDLENEFNSGLEAINLEELRERRTSQDALAAAMNSQDRVRMIETFLKTGPSANSPTVVVLPASRRK